MFFLFFKYNVPINLCVSINFTNFKFNNYISIIRSKELKLITGINLFLLLLLTVDITRTIWWTNGGGNRKKVELKTACCMDKLLCLLFLYCLSIHCTLCFGIARFLFYYNYYYFLLGSHSIGKARLEPPSIVSSRWWSWRGRLP